ncbi:MAG: glycosyltransferase, partial [Pseudomonadota bacterium]
MYDIAVLLPCYNEGQTIADVVRRFKETLPRATVYVYDNNSTDGTAIKARLAGAVVVPERRQGKGHVVRRMFADIEADIYIMADGDGTYMPEEAPELINTLISERSDMVVGTRAGVKDDAGRAGH